MVSLSRIALTAVLTLAATHAKAAITQLDCGDTVLPGQKVKLEQSVGPCTQATGGITVIGPATLDLNGHSITCLVHPDLTAVPTGLRVVGERAKIKNGNVVACRHGVAVNGNGRHRILGMTAAFNHLNGFQVSDDRIVLKNNEALNNGKHGMILYGERIVAKKNLLTDNGSAGLLVDGTEGAVLVKNIALDNGSFGVAIFAHGGRPHKIIRNVSSGNDNWDVYADASDCTQDVWRANLFSSANRSCVQ